MALKLQDSEKRLLIAFGILGFLVLNFIGYTYWQDKESRTASKTTVQTKELKRLDALKSKIPMASQYQETLAKYLKCYDSLDTRDTNLTSFVQKVADDGRLKLAKNTPLASEQPDADKPAKFIKSAYRAEASGSYKEVMSFIMKLQEPTEFRFVKSMKISPRKSEANDGESDLVCDFTIQKWWHPESDDLIAKASAAAEKGTATAAEGATATEGAAAPVSVPVPADAPAAAPTNTEQKAPTTVGTTVPPANVQ